MPTLSVRKLDPHVYSQLRVRAASRGHSMEEEARQILKTAVMAPERLGDRISSYFGPRHGAELVVPRRVPHEPPEIE